MDAFKIGDIVARKSYNFDIMFKIVGIRNEIVDLVRYNGKNCSRCANIWSKVYR